MSWICIVRTKFSYDWSHNLGLGLAYKYNFVHWGLSYQGEYNIKRFPRGIKSPRDLFCFAFSSLKQYLSLSALFLPKAWFPRKKFGNCGDVNHYLISGSKKNWNELVPRSKLLIIWYMMQLGWSRVQKTFMRRWSSYLPWRYSTNVKKTNARSTRRHLYVFWKGQLNFFCI